MGADAGYGSFSLLPPRERVEEVELESQVELVGRNQSGGPLEEAGRGLEVEPRQRSAACGGEALLRSCHQRLVRRLAQLFPVASGLLEVVSEQLVQLGERGAMLFEPAGKARVKLRSRGLRHRFVRGVADQEMAE